MKIVSLLATLQDSVVSFALIFVFVNALSLSLWLCVYHKGSISTFLFVGILATVQTQDGKDCVFPFKVYKNGKIWEYNSCTTDWYNGGAWCPTKDDLYMGQVSWQSGINSCCWSPSLCKPSCSVGNN